MSDTDLQAAARELIVLKQRAGGETWKLSAENTETYRFVLDAVTLSVPLATTYLAAVAEVEQLKKENEKLHEDMRFLLADEVTPEVEAAGVAMAKTLDCFEESNARIAELEDDVERLNQMLRDTGYGQGQIDAYAAQCEEIERLTEKLERVCQCENCDEWDDTTKEPPAWVVCWKCYNQTNTKLNKANTRIAALEAALTPFATGVDYFDEEFAGQDTSEWQVNPYKNGITVGDCRRARDVLKEQGE